MKWIMATVAVLVLVFAVLFALGRETFHAEITIKATPEEVWSVLIDARGYESWNPLLVPVSGEFREGAAIEYRMTQPNGKEVVMNSRVKKMIPNKELNQHAGIPGVLTADHSYRLEPVQGGTRLVQYEIDNGIAMLFWDSSWVQSTYEKVNLALKKRVEQLKASR